MRSVFFHFFLYAGIDLEHVYLFTTKMTPSPLMKRDTVYWIVTGLFAVLMMISAIPDILQVPAAVTLVVDHLGYPRYFLPYLGTAKAVGAIVVLIPGFRRIKEWAFAGFAIDLCSAIYSSIAVGDAPGKWLPITVGLAMLAAAYTVHIRRVDAVPVA